MIKLNTIYRTNKKYYIVIVRDPTAKCYELHRSVWESELEDFDYLLNKCNPLFASNNLSVVRYYARQIMEVC